MHKCCFLVLTALFSLSMGVLHARVNPGWEIAEQYRSLERLDVKDSRKERIQAWLGEKRPMKAVPDYSSTAKADLMVPNVFSCDGMLLVFDKKSGLPTWLSFNGGENILINDACSCPLWEIAIQEPEAEKLRFIGPYECEVAFKRYLGAPPNLEIIYTCKEAVVKVRVTKAEEGPFARFTISVKNNIAANRIDRVDFPKFALRPRGEINDANQIVVLPWRRGRLRPLSGFLYGYHEEYPCSSARFQMISLYNDMSGKGIYFQSEDGDGWEKHFLQSYVPAYKAFISNLLFYPPDRGKAGNNLDKSFSCILGTFDGDWYDASQIYRKWFLKQKWASRGPIYKNDTPDFLKHSPVWLRFYLRESRGYRPDSVLTSFNSWKELLPNWPMPGTLYHYSQFKEPENKPNYPVCEYYGYCAPPFPGLTEVLKETTSQGLRCSVYWQSEIINQDAPENASLAPANKLDIKGNPVLYLEERGILCRQSPIWHKRNAEAHEHLAKIGFTGFYLDTYGKSKPDTQCYDTRHGHIAGGANQECAAQRAYGKAVRKHMRAMDKEFYMGGEASCECYIDLLDYKLNAVSTYPGHIPLERAIYGDYILSHGRTVRENYSASELRQIGFDFLEGNIPGRFFGKAPTGQAEREFIVNITKLTEAAYDYMRTGRMLRPLKFGKPMKMMSLTEPQKMETEEWRNAVYQSYMDNSIGVAVFHFGEQEDENSLLLPESMEVAQLLPDGTKKTLGKIKEIPLKLKPNEFCVFIIKK